MPAIEVEADEESARAIELAKAIVEQVRTACSGSASTMVGVLIGASILVCREQRNPDEVLAIIADSIADARKRLADPRRKAS